MMPPAVLLAFDVPFLASEVRVPSLISFVLINIRIVLSFEHILYRMAVEFFSTHYSKIGF